jgi:hypothetical protein
MIYGAEMLLVQRGHNKMGRRNLALSQGLSSPFIVSPVLTFAEGKTVRSALEDGTAGEKRFSPTAN